MSRAERRAYERMTKKQDPYALPPVSGAAKARMERQRARRAAQDAGDPGRLLGRRGLWWVIGGTAIAFLIALSLAWPNGSGMALVAGAAAGIGWLVLSLAFAWWRRRARLAGRDGTGGSRPARR